MMHEEEVEIRVAAQTAQLDNVMQWVEAKLEEHGFSQSSVMKAAIATEEIFVNICSYAYGENKGEVDIRFWKQNGQFSICFVDSGTPFNPLQAPKPNVKAPQAARSEGGLGIFMAKEFVFEMQYEYTDGQNKLTMVLAQ